MAATMKLSLTFALLIFSVSGFMVFGDAAEGTCSFLCMHRGHITCENHPGEKLKGCNCACAPKDGGGCVVHLHGGSTKNCTKE